MNCALIRLRPTGTRGAWLLRGLLILIATSSLTGCIVTQPRGEGDLRRVVEPQTRRGYWRYLPVDYLEAEKVGELDVRRWPVVVTFHGMKPFDNALFQAAEWQQEADRYGFVVVVPELRAADVLAQFPVRSVHPAFAEDERVTLAILDHVLSTTAADPKNVFSTSFSSGGYLAHYMLNRHPDRFAALAVRQSNFSPYILDSERAADSRQRPVLIVNTQNDVPVCRQESQDAVRWYSAHGYPNLAWVLIRYLGHVRTPDTAADFFGRIAGVTPSRPPTVLAYRQAIDGNADGLALLTGKAARFDATQVASSPRSLPATKRFATPPADEPEIQPAADAGVAQQPAPAAPADAPTATRRDLVINAAPRAGAEPLVVTFSATTPLDWRRTAQFRWLLNGRQIGTSPGGTQILQEPGEHTLELVVTTSSGVEHRASQTIRVVPRLSATAAVSGR